MGLVNAVHAPEELMDRTVEYATELATWSSPTSMAIMKKQVYEHMERGAADAVEGSPPGRSGGRAAAVRGRAFLGLRVGRRGLVRAESLRPCPGRVHGVSDLAGEGRRNELE